MHEPVIAGQGVGGGPGARHSILVGLPVLAGWGFGYSILLWLAGKAACMHGNLDAGMDAGGRARPGRAIPPYSSNYALWAKFTVATRHN